MTKIKKTVFVFVLFGLTLFGFAGCGNDKSYLDENGNYYFGEWAFELNGAEGLAAMYDLSDEELGKWLDENGYTEAGVTVDSARSNIIYSVISVAQMSDEEIKTTYGANDDEIKKFRDYVAHVFGDPADYDLADYAPDFN